MGDHEQRLEYVEEKMKDQVRLLAKKLQETQKASDSALSIVMESCPDQNSRDRKKVEDSTDVSSSSKAESNRTMRVCVSYTATSVEMKVTGLPAEASLAKSKPSRSFNSVIPNGQG